MRVNFDYLKVFKEPFWFAVLIVRHWFSPKSSGSSAILIVNTCLVGEFAASAPAMHAYIERHRGAPIDLLVSLPLKPLAERMRGVRTVYVATSVFARDIEKQGSIEVPPHDYGEVLAMRISPAAYRLLGETSARNLRTGFPSMAWYGAHLLTHLIRGRTPRSWREISFRMVGEKAQDFSFDEMFSFSREDRERIGRLPAVATRHRKVILHICPSLPTNRWPTASWVALLTQLHARGDLHFIFIGAKRDAPDCESIASQLPFPTHSLMGELDFAELTLLLSMSDYFIGVDSGPRNLAHLVDLPSITLLGPGPHMYTPPDPRDIVLDHSGGRGVYQRFISKTRDRYIDRITVREVVDAFGALRARADLKAREEAAQSA